MGLGKFFWNVFGGSAGTTLSDRTGMDSNGHLLHKIGGNMAMDLTDGSITPVVGWDDDKKHGGFDAFGTDDPFGG